jgi:hypothetical protein
MAQLEVGLMAPGCGRWGESSIPVSGPPLAQLADGSRTMFSPLQDLIAGCPTCLSAVAGSAAGSVATVGSDAPPPPAALEGRDPFPSHPVLSHLQHEAGRDGTWSPPPTAGGGGGGTEPTVATEPAVLPATADKQVVKPAIRSRS